MHGNTATEYLNRCTILYVTWSLKVMFMWHMHVICNIYNIYAYWRWYQYFAPYNHLDGGGWLVGGENSLISHLLNITYLQSISHSPLFDMITDTFNTMLCKGLGWVGCLWVLGWGEGGRISNGEQRKWLWTTNIYSFDLKIHAREQLLKNPIWMDGYTET